MKTATELAEIYDTGFMETINRCDSEAGIVLLEAVKKLFPEVTSVFDAGCATGCFLQHFSNAGYAIKGVDISPSAKTRTVINPNIIDIVDLRDPYDAGQEYDLTICIETIEHIEKEALDTFLENLKRFSPLLIATPGNQGGVGHFNCQPPTWWIHRFREHGMCFDAQASHGLHEFVSKPEYDLPQLNFPYMRKGIMVFRRQESQVNEKVFLHGK